MIKKSGMVSIVGRPNVGKSTLINALAGEKIAIVSDKPQTTRNRIMGVVSKGETQVVFMDTPGLHKPKTKLGEYMVKVVRESVTDVDAILMLVHPVDEIGAAEEALIQSIEASGLPAILIINKIDTVDASRLFPVIEKYSDRFNFSAIIPISAKNGDGVDLVMDEVEKFIPEGYALFPEDMVSDQPERVMIAEIIREKLLNCLNREVPHGTAVEITKFTERENEIIDVCATIYCEKDSHKGIIIGKRGAMLKKISTLSREEIEKFMGTKVYLETWVKVKENWRESDFLLRNFGYE
ncbi:MAG: GTPase Era [Clostridia bacterium]|nr:GTPase Era [Clostridia bacterium]